jgi:hypothetical protein
MEGVGLGASQGPRPLPPNEARRLAAGQPQVRTVQERENPIRPEPRKARRGLRPAYDDDPAARRDLGQDLGQHIVERSTRRYVVIVVQDEGDRSVEPAEQLPEVATGEQRECRAELGGQDREGATTLGSGKGQIVEEARRIGVALVELTPERV